MLSHRGFAFILFVVTAFGLIPAVGLSQSENGTGWSSEYLHHGTNIRARGLGGAYVSLADDASATMYNPAGLMRVDGPQILGVFDYHGGNALSFSSALAIPRSKWLGDFWGRYMAVGAAWTHLYSEGAYYVNEFGRRRKGAGTSEGAVFVSVAGETDLWEKLNGSLGVTWKTYYGESEDSLLTSTLDFGLQFQILSFVSTPQINLIPLRFGIMCENCVGNKNDSQEEDAYYAPRNWRFGLSYAGVPRSVTFWPQSIRPTVTFEWDMDDDFKKRRRFRAGIELARIVGNESPIALRAGVADVADDTWEWSVSVGIRLPLKSAAVGMDMLMHEDIVRDGESVKTSSVNSISLTYTLSNSNSGEGLRVQANDAKLRRDQTDSLEIVQTELDSVYKSLGGLDSETERQRLLDSVSVTQMAVDSAKADLSRYGSYEHLKFCQKYLAFQALARYPNIDLCAISVLLADLKGSPYWNWLKNDLDCEDVEPPPAEAARTPSAPSENDDEQN